ncbi:MAG TPA: hypothetical protein VMV61_06995 [Patescibacteria group bacterium]|nr:hypothetical protein [Terriglobales bacterium]HVN08699.1 hypothetical protein [Patescibacteria group bacterium]
MRISTDQIPGATVEPQSTTNSQASNQKTSTTSTTESTVESTSQPAETAIVTPAQRETDVTFRRDSNGRIYYVVADAKSGEEIMEVPAKAVRDVDQGISDYLKQEGAKGGTHVKVKA